jgi:hypothetical protein
MLKYLTLAITLIALQGCLGTIIGTTADVAIEVVKVPFKVTGAAIDLMTDDDDEDD